MDVTQTCTEYTHTHTVCAHREPWKHKPNDGPAAAVKQLATLTSGNTRKMNFRYKHTDIHYTPRSTYTHTHTHLHTHTDTKSYTHTVWPSARASLIAALHVDMIDFDDDSHRLGSELNPDTLYCSAYVCVRLCGVCVCVCVCVCVRVCVLVLVCVHTFVLMSDCIYSHQYFLLCECPGVYLDL